MTATVDGVGTGAGAGATAGGGTAAGAAAEGAASRVELAQFARRRVPRRGLDGIAVAQQRQQSNGGAPIGRLFEALERQQREVRRPATARCRSSRSSGNARDDGLVARARPTAAARGVAPLGPSRSSRSRASARV